VAGHRTLDSAQNPPCTVTIPRCTGTTLPVDWSTTHSTIGLQAMGYGLMRTAIFGILTASAAFASGINVFTDSQVTLDPGDTLLFYLSAENTPGQILMALGGPSTNQPDAPIPGTSAVYMPGDLFTATLESPDGSMAIPLLDPNAARLGLPNGDLLLTTGSVSGGAYSGPISLLSAAVILSSDEAAALTGSGEFVLAIRDLSGEITFGYPGSPLTNAFTAHQPRRNHQRGCPDPRRRSDPKPRAGYRGTVAGWTRPAGRLRPAPPHPFALVSCPVPP
jgi:hypothetical protein